MTHFPIPPSIHSTFAERKDCHWKSTIPGPHPHHSARSLNVSPSVFCRACGPVAPLSGSSSCRATTTTFVSPLTATLRKRRAPKTKCRAAECLVPLVNIQKTMENQPFLRGKSTINDNFQSKRCGCVWKCGIPSQMVILIGIPSDKLTVCELGKPIIFNR